MTEFAVGDRVFHHGRPGTIQHVSLEPYPYRVEFDDGSHGIFTPDELDVLLDEKKDFDGGKRRS
jgi:hypothetical protein